MIVEKVKVFNLIVRLKLVMGVGVVIVFKEGIPIVLITKVDIKELSFQD